MTVLIAPGTENADGEDADANINGGANLRRRATETAATMQSERPLGDGDCSEFAVEQWRALPHDYLHLSPHHRHYSLPTRSGDGAGEASRLMASTPRSSFRLPEFSLVGSELVIEDGSIVLSNGTKEISLPGPGPAEEDELSTLSRCTHALRGQPTNEEILAEENSQELIRYNAARLWRLHAAANRAASAVNVEPPFARDHRAAPTTLDNFLLGRDRLQATLRELKASVAANILRTNQQFAEESRQAEEYAQRLEQNVARLRQEERNTIAALLQHMQACALDMREMWTKSKSTLHNTMELLAAAGLSATPLLQNKLDSLEVKLHQLEQFATGTESAVKAISSSGDASAAACVEAEKQAAMARDASRSLFESFSSGVREIENAYRNAQRLTRSKQSATAESEAPVTGMPPRLLPQVEQTTSGTSLPTVTAIDSKSRTTPKTSALASMGAQKEKFESAEFMASVQRNIATLVSDRSSMRLRMAIKMRINHEVNTIAATVGQVGRKINALAVIIAEASRSDAPIMVTYARDLIARALVSLGSSQVHVHQKSAFPVAYVIVGLSAKDSQFRDLILAHFRAQCSYVLPVWPPAKRKEEGVEDYLRVIGYNAVDEEGTLETEERYTERMQGLVSLYAAVLQIDFPGEHPFGIDKAWTWMARLLNLPPARIAPYLLLSFLQVAGYALLQRYRKQFVKLVNVIRNDYISTLPRRGAEAAVARLEMFCADCTRNNCIPEPEGRQLEIADIRTYGERD